MFGLAQSMKLNHPYMLTDVLIIPRVNVTVQIEVTVVKYFLCVVAFRKAIETKTEEQ